jgi:hypothetical protein
MIFLTNHQLITEVLMSINSRGRVTCTFDRGARQGSDHSQPGRQQCHVASAAAAADKPTCCPSRSTAGWAHPGSRSMVPSLLTRRTCFRSCSQRYDPTYASTISLKSTRQVGQKTRRNDSTASGRSIDGTQTARINHIAIRCKELQYHQRCGLRGKREEG